MNPDQRFPYALWINRINRKRAAIPVTPNDNLIEEMPPSRRPRGSPAYRRRGNRRMVQRVPRAIQTRGTPDGYYEIPSTILLRFYFNTSTGIWDTDQTTGAQLGLTGYPGMGFRFNPTTIQGAFGDAGAISRNAAWAIPGSTELSNVFNEMKTARIDLEYWVATQTPGGHTTTGYDPEFWAVFDPNDSFPPGRDSISQYSRPLRILTDRPTKQSIVPKLVMDAVGDAGSGATTTPGISQTATYVRSDCSVPAYGIKLYYWIPNTGANTYIGYLNIRMRFIRRYKVNI